MSMSIPSLPLALSFFFFFFLCAFLSFPPTTTALPRPFTKESTTSIPKPQTCQTLDFPSKITILQLPNLAGCLLYSSSDCTGPPTDFPLLMGPNTPSLEISSLFCGSIANRLSRKRRTLPSEDNPPQPYAEAIPSPAIQSSPGLNDAKLTPWKPPANSWPKDTAGCGGDGPYYASGGSGCIGPGKTRRVRDEE